MSLEQLWKIVQHQDVNHLQVFLDGLPVNKREELLRSVHKKSGDHVTHLLARHGRLNMLKLLRDLYNVRLEVANLDEKVPLHEAASSCHADVVRYLLSQSVSVDPLKHAGWTPLMMGCTKKGNIACVKLLVEAGARLDLVNKDGWNCFHIACREDDVDIISYLHHKAPFLCNNVSNNGRTALHTAALHGRSNVVSFLLQTCKARRRTKDACGTSSFMDAVRSGDVPTMRLLLNDDKSELLERNAMGLSCLHIAAEADQTKALLFLVEGCGMDVDCRVEDENMYKSQTPLHIAHKERNKAAISTLIILGADCYVTDAKGRRPCDVEVRKWEV